jgi:hypothetical protein
MIETVGDFLEKLAQAEAAKLAASDIKHPTVIGSMYEGLTRDILTRTIPPGLDLRVVDGFVTDGLGNRSGQIDCMLVRGQGTPVPYMEGTFDWPVKDVLAVFEVKKNLFGNDLSDAFVHVRSVLDTYSSYIQNERGSETLNLRPTYRAYAETTGEIPPASGMKEMPRDKHLIFHSMMADQIAPIRIILGYGGYSTEYGLREGFLQYLGRNLNVLGFGPPSVPNLIVAGKASLVKLSGHPYHAQLLSNGRWPLMASAGSDPIHFILELIWTRITYLHEVSGLFGDDLTLEALSPLLDALPTTKPDNPAEWGWRYYSHSFTNRQLSEACTAESWQPIELDSHQFEIVNRLCSEDVNTDNDDFRAFVSSADLDEDAFIKSLTDTTLVARQGSILKLTTIVCRCVVLPDGRFVAADDNSGRLTRWLSRYLADRSHAAKEPKELGN